MTKISEIYSAMESHGFHPGEIIPDGKIHRFDREGKSKNEHSWYVCFANHTRKGEDFFVAEFGDWKNGDQYKIVSSFASTKEDRKLIEDNVKRIQAQRDADRSETWEKTAAAAEKEWLKYRSVGESEYLIEKGLPGSLYGARVMPGMTVVPVRDLAGKLWGYQRIYPAGKFFRVGTKKEGNFHLIGSWQPGDLIYVAEGFATGISVHIATSGKAVAVAFDSGNLDSVGAVFRGASRDSAIVFCGDDDRWATRPDGTSFNPGREKAETAAARHLGSAVFPDFSDLAGRPTDFNDLHNLDGLAAVTSQLGGIKYDVQRVSCLGHLGNTYYYASSSNQQVVDIAGGAHSKHNLFGLMPLEYWEAQYPSKNGGADWDRAVSEMMEGCRSVGIFRPENVRGAGVWRDQGRLVINLGNALWVDGEVMGMQEFKSKNTYEIARRTLPPHERPLTAAEGAALVDAISCARWKKPDYAKILAGWVVLAPLSGLLSWRPHVWLTGPSGAGKSWVIDNVAHVLLNDHKLSVQGQSTEAGVRQEVRYDARPLVFDEFETDDKKSAERVEFTLELMRQASTDSSSMVLKGTASGRAMSFRVRFSALVASIRLNLEREQDRNRFTVIELVRGEAADGPEQRRRLDEKSAIITEELGRRMFSRSIKLLPLLEQNRAALHAPLRAMHSDRFAQQYGMLLAGYALLTRDRALSAEEAADLVRSLDLVKEVEAVADRDENDCLNLLMRHVGEWNLGRGAMNERLSVIEVVRAAKDPVDTANAKAADLALQRFGMHIVKDKLAVANSVKEIKKVFYSSKWQKGYSSALLRVNGAKQGNARLLGQQTSCVMIPLEIVMKGADNYLCEAKESET